MPELIIRKVVVVTEEDRHTHGHTDEGGPLRKVAAAAVVHNPMAGMGYVEDLSSIVEASAHLGGDLGGLCQEALADTADSYGKAGIVGVGGDKEHAHAALTSVFGNEFRKAIGGAEAWLSSTKKMGGPGTSIDVPLAFKDEVWVRSHYDTITVTLADAPLPDEMVIIAAVANRGRIGARVGGRTKEQVLAERGGS